MAIENLPAENSREPLPPHNTDAEAAVLGGLLIDRDAIGRVATFLRPADFYRERNATIFAAMVALYERREPVDYLTLSDELQRTGRYDEVGGLVYLSSLFNEVPTSLHVEQYARIVEQASLRRRLIRAAGRIAGLGYDESLEAEKALEEAEQVLFAVAERRLSRDFRKLADVLREYWEQLLLAADVDRLERGIPTSYKDLDKLLGGLQRSDLVIVAARPSMGKSSFALCLARNASVDFGAKVGIFSLEMSLAQLAQRLLFSESGVDSSRLRQGLLGQVERRKLADALGTLASAPIYLDDTPNIALSELRAKSRRLHQELGGLDLLVVDYLQLIQGNGKENRVNEISEISRSLKALARELDVPVVALSQLSRAVESRSPHIPMLSDLRESGCLTGDTLVALADGRRVPIAALVGQQPEVVTLDGWQVTHGRASRVWLTGHRPVYRLTTRSGRTIRATANHPFRVLHGWRALADLAVGERIALPRRYPEPPAAQLWDDDRLVLLAHLIGDGCYVRRQPLHYTSASEANRAAVEQAAKQVFGVVARRVVQSSWQHVYLTAGGNRWSPNPIHVWLRELGIDGQHSYEKVIPEAIFRLSSAQIGLFLRHLWATDGCTRLRRTAHGQTGTVYYATTSPYLASQVQHLLVRLGIASRVYSTRKGDQRVGYQIHVTGSTEQLKFARAVGAFGDRVEQLAEIEDLYRTVAPNPNNDTVPLEVWRDVRTAMQALGVSQRQMAALRGTSYGGTSHFSFAPTRQTLTNYAELLQDQRLREVAAADVYWDQIVAIEPDGEADVYDMTVPGTHNFVANGMVVHNSIEQDADVVMFIYREEVYDRDTENKGIAEIHVAKHRNGPTGQVSLLWLEKLTKFVDLGVER
ncbi:MAG TPA: replicative DNA helicase [Chloroflexota bacterium]|nr:replicative DNA helicase [Chloroflexota bacterium]